MRIELITMWYNEEFLAPFFLNHYSWVTKIHILLDADTTDRTEAIAKLYPNVVLEHFRFPDMMDDILKVKKFNEKYRSLTQADYVILVDSDEFIFCNYLSKPVRDHLEATMKDVYFVNLWQVYKHEKDPTLDPDTPVFLQRRHGDSNMFDPFNILYVKPIVVKGHKDIAWTPGNHELIYNGKSLIWITRNTDNFAKLNVSTTKEEMLQGAHWKLVDLDKTIIRRIRNRKERQSQTNLSKGLTYQYHAITEDEIIKEYNDHKNDPEVIMDDGIPLWQPAKGIIKECEDSKYPPLEELPAYYRLIRPEILSEIPMSAMNILDVGCGAGVLGRELKMLDNRRKVIGIELNENACRRAYYVLDHVYCADVERFDPPFKQEEFDCIIFADILEHLVDPWNITKRYAAFLKPGGYVVASIPNVQNITVIEDLIKGHWLYQDAGILDATHLRFFTKASLNNLFSRAGLTIKNIKHVINPPLDMQKVKESGNKYRKGNLEIADLTKSELLNLFTYQFIVILQKTVSGKSSTSGGEHLLPHFDHDNMVPALSSIIILTFNQLEYTKKCVKSICKYTPETHEIIFVDNGSTDGTVKWLKRLIQENKNYKLIENKKNLGFSKGSNQGIEASQGEFILLLNNDVVVAEGWLSGLLDCLQHTPDAGIVGPMTNKISGPQQINDNSYLSVNFIDKYAEQFRGQYHHRRIPLRRIVGFCMLFKRTLVEQIGMLDETFGTGNFEDDDFCLRAALAGYRNYIAGDVFVHHYGSRSFIGNKINYGASISDNRKIIEKKWALSLLNPEGKKLAVLKITELANDFYQQGRVDQAIEAMIHCIKFTPDAKEIYYELSRIFLESKKYPEAWEVIESMPEAAKHELKGLECAGYAKEGLGLDDEAASYAERMLSLDDNNPAAINLKGVLAYKKSERKNAANYFNKVIDADPGYGEAYTNLGVLHWGMDEKDQALAHLRKGFALSPTLQDASQLYYSAVSSLGAYPDSEAEFREACRFYPNNRTLTFLYIDVLIQQGKFDLALTKIEDALALFGLDDGTLNAALAVREKVGPLHIEKSLKKRTLSLCMIVKNEERNLVKCLKSVRDIVDEMIIVDTGSTDKTNDIAKVFGAKVFDFPWMGDFSAARNHSLQQAAGDWILILDADEVISVRDFDELKALIRKSPLSPTVYSIVTRNYIDNVNIIGWKRNDGQYSEEAGAGWVPSQKVRLFTRRKELFFSDPVHETLETSMRDAKITSSSSKIVVHHYGKLDMEKDTQKGENYYLLGKMKYESDPANVKYIYELAIQAHALNKCEEAVTLWLQLISLIEANPESPKNKAIARDSYGKPLPEIYIQLASTYLMLERYEEALAAARKALATEIKLKEYVHVYAHCEIIAGSLINAYSALEELLETTPDYGPALFMKAVIFCLEGKTGKAQGLFQLLMQKGVQLTPLLNNIAKELHAGGKRNEALLIRNVTTESRMQDDETGNLLESLQT